MELKEIIRQGYLELSKNGTVYLYDIVAYLKEVHGISASFGKAHREVMDFFYEVQNEVFEAKAKKEPEPETIPAYKREFHHEATRLGASLEEAAIILSESVSTVREWVACGKLVAFRAPSIETGQMESWLERDQLYAINTAKKGYADYGQEG